MDQDFLGFLWDSRICDPLAKGVPGFHPVDPELGARVKTRDEFLVGMVGFGPGLDSVTFPSLSDPGMAPGGAAGDFHSQFIQSGG